MNRRKGVPCGCDAEPCGCSPKNHCVKAISNVSPDPNGDFTITEGDNIEITEISNGIEIGMKNPLTDDLNIQADLTVDGDIIANGDIIQNGSSYETHAEKVYTNDDYIVMRDGAVGALAAGDYSGFQVKKYDGTNDGRLVIDRDGTARVGDVGDEQPLTTRDEAINLIGGHLLKWDAAELKLIDAGVRPQDLGLQFVGESTGSITVTYPNQRSSASIPLPTGVSFANGYDYLITIFTAPNTADVGVRLAVDYASDGDVSIPIYYNSGESDFYYTANIYKMPASDPTRIKLYMASPSRMEVQEKLVSGTNIKTIGGQSILGSGDIPAGGLNWTLRTANDDWTDMFDYANSILKAKKHLYLIDSSGDSQRFTPVYIAKNTQFVNNISDCSIYEAYRSIRSGFVGVSRKIYIAGSKISSSNTNFTTTEYGYELTTDGTTVTITGKIYTASFSKSYFVIYTAD